MKKFLLVLVIFLIVVVLGFAASMKEKNTSIALLRMCPDQMINNKMPGPGGAKPSYYIVKGERKEISEFDAAWVTANCNVPVQDVY